MIEYLGPADWLKWQLALPRPMTEDERWEWYYAWRAVRARRFSVDLPLTPENSGVQSPQMPEGPR